MRVAADVLAEPYATYGLRESVDLFLWSLPVLLVWMVAVALLSGRLARFLETQRWVAFLLLASLGLILSATLTPTTGELESYFHGISVGECDLSRLVPLSPREVVADFDAVVNILLFLAFGFALGLLPRTRRNLLIVLASFSLTFLIETLQLVQAELGRGCESADIVDNTLGLVIGLAAGAVVQAVVARRQAQRGPE